MDSIQNNPKKCLVDTKYGKLGVPSYKNRNNTIDIAIFNDMKISWFYNLVKKSALTATLSYIDISFNGSVNSSLNYIMLEALQAGKNMIWQLSWNKKLSSNIQMRFSYDGRWAEDSRVVHVGRAQVRYVF